MVAVASGDGIAALFTHLGADRIISGGQTANPSIEEFVEAFRQCETEHILVLPNNKNIMLAAKQAAEIYTDATVHVIESKNLMQGYSALSVITPGITDVNALIKSAESAAKSVVDGEITMAVRDATIGGKEIHCGDYIAISEGEITAVAQTAEEATMKMLETADADLCEIITLFVGHNVSPERCRRLEDLLKDTYQDCEVVIYDGGQEVYDYLIALE